MKVTAILSALVAVTTATSLHSKLAVALEDSLAVPGENPLFFCEDPAGDSPYILKLDSVDLDPNPPLAGKNLTITAEGTVTKAIEDGAKVHLQIKYGVITIIRQTYELCELVENVDLECPIKEGKTKLTRKVELPSVIPPGKYTVLANVETKDEKKITCLTAQVEFHRSGSAQKVLGGKR